MKHLLSLLIILLCWSTKADQPQVLITKIESVADKSLSQPEEALEQLENLNQKYKLQQGNYAAVFWLNLAKVYDQLYRYQLVEDAIATGKSAKQNSLSFKQLSEYLYFDALILERQGKYQRAIEVFQLCIDSSRRYKLQQLEITCAQEQAYTYSLNEQFEKALQILRDASKQATIHEYEFELARVRESFGAVYGYLGDYKNSERNYLSALETYKSYEYPKYIAEATYGLASTYRYQENYLKALEYYQKYQTISNQHPFDHSQFLALYGLAMTYALLDNCDQALSNIDQALAFSGNQDYKAELHKKAALCYINARQFEEAKQSLDFAAQIFNDIPELINTSWQNELTFIEAKLAFQQENYLQSFKLMEKYHQQYVDYSKRTNSETLNKLRAELEVKNKDLQIALLTKQRALDKLTLKRQQELNDNQELTNYLWMVFSMFVVILIVIQRRVAIKFKKLAIRDPLTGLFNRRFTFESLESQIKNVKDSSGHFTILVIDVDDFKSINDEYSHLVGDKVLIELGKAAQKQLRPGDFIGRIGGEEFMVILRRVHIKEATAISQRLLDAANAITIKEIPPGRMLSLSIGITQYSEEYETATAMYQKADLALYAAKANGKNTFKIA